MRLGITVDQRYWQTPDGAVWTRMPPDWRFFTQHLEVFDSAVVAARCTDVAAPPDGALRANAPGVDFLRVPNYSGVAGFLEQSLRTTRVLRKGLNDTDALLLRVPSNVANCVPLRSRTYAVEVLADPVGLYSEGASRSPLRSICSRWFSVNLRRQCRQAAVAAFVSDALAEQYTTAPRHILLDIDLPDSAFGAPRRLPQKDTYEVITVGAFDHPVKGHDVLIRAIAIARTKGLDLHLTIVGEGRLHAELASLAEDLKVPCRFAGQLGGADQVRELLRNADLFALASRSEGKPRTLVEAMALGVPCVATNVGGIPEVLSEEQLVPRDDPSALATVISGTLFDAARYERLSLQGITASRPFSAAEQRAKRKDFLLDLRSASRDRQRRNHLARS